MQGVNESLVGRGIRRKDTPLIKKEHIFPQKNVLFILLLNTYHCNKNSCHDRNVHQ